MVIVTAIILAMAFPKHIGDRYAPAMAAAKAITTVHTAQIEYYSQHRRYATFLSQLAPLIDRDLASGETGGSKFVVRQTPTGYALAVASGTHSYYSDQSLVIHVHAGPEPATVNDPLLGATLQLQQQAAP